jgi:hypothetical protein
MTTVIPCERGDDTGWVCEAHDDRPWDSGATSRPLHMRRARHAMPDVQRERPATAVPGLQD